MPSRPSPVAQNKEAIAAAPSLFSALAAASSTAATTTARGADVLAEAVARGVAQLRSELVRVSTKLGELVHVVSCLRMGHETLARGHERVLMSMMVMRGDFTRVLDKLEPSF